MAVGRNPISVRLVAISVPEFCRRWSQILSTSDNRSSSSFICDHRRDLWPSLCAGRCGGSVGDRPQRSCCGLVVRGSHDPAPIADRKSPAFLPCSRFRAMRPSVTFYGSVGDRPQRRHFLWLGRRPATTASVLNGPYHARIRLSVG